MKYLNGFNDFLFEYKVSIDDIYQKYYKDLDYNMFLEVISFDPTTNIEKGLMGSYSKWLLNLFKNDNLKIEDFYKAKEYLEIFHNFKHKITHKDINFYKSLPELFIVIEPFKEKEEFKFSNDEEKKLVGQFKEIFRNGDYRIIIPLTLEASKYFGRDTQWCTVNTNMFKKYTRRQTEDITIYNLYILYPIKDKDELQFHFSSRQFMDKNDNEIDIDSFFDRNKDIFDFFNKYFYVKNYTKDMKTVKWDKNTLEGASTIVYTNFYCHDYSLTSLKGGPITVYGTYWCSKNKLTSLVGGPTFVDNSYWCNNNQLTSLKGAPTNINDDFGCQYNSLTTLVGGPITVYGNFDCRHNNLISLDGAPTVYGNFDCTSNKNLSKEEIIKYKNNGAVKGTIFSDYGQF